ncbi:glutamine-hydrolyzing carbamoyl-phosphate synthase small subunit [Candidatus Protochlamydia sp. W-9]|uniref:glutamine-hydrolyzing carbamoyl-phosphate synthase small subunit n=1 Tax=Candidatus Protochlamydia sp. W-9 TaxID=1785087 RepID=UPI00096A43C6|nr:glutamine-hydrolyzing carbamoyl-phosphate synthase small subunit [Candidatus Protochlamydia sp. W-9]
MITPNSILVLDDGSYYLGNFLSSQGETRGELCFNTSMTGYQEAISDPSYYGQIVVFTFPYIGNTGINSKDHESNQIHLKGLVIANEITAPSSQRSESHLAKWLKDYNIVGICNVNTRNLVKKIRDARRPIQCMIGSFSENKKKDIIHSLHMQLQDGKGLSGENYSIRVQNDKKLLFHNVSMNSKKKIVILDFGLKKSILQAFQLEEFEIILLSGNSPLKQILDHQPAGIILSNGPGDPRSTVIDKSYTINKIIDLEIPLLGICLGFQLIGLSLGGMVSQLPCGHHGSNHPVYDLALKKILITSQNHEFQLLSDSLPAFVKPSHISLFDNSLEGFTLEKKPVIAVQFHPEGNPGPNDCAFIFKNFLDLVRQYAKKN